MSWIHRKALAVVAVGAGVATLLGATLGVAVAKHTNTVGGVCSGGGAGCNIHYVGAIRNGSVSPDSFTKCIPAADWEAIYIWDGPNQQWQHFFNITKTPAYVNDTSAGGISTIPGFSGVVLIMKLGSPSQQITLLDGNSESCS
ncbi:MAG: hypothetical protein ABI577_09790 [bacterium]